MKTIKYKGEKITHGELAKIAGWTYGKTTALIYRDPGVNGEQIIAIKPRKEETYNGITLSLVEWADRLDVNLSNFRIKAYAIGSVEAIDYYVKGKHLTKNRTRRGLNKTSKTLDAVDIKEFEFDANLHAQRLLDSGLSYLQVKERMVQAGGF